MNKVYTHLTTPHAENLSPIALKELVQKYFGLVRYVSHSIAARNTKSTVLTPEDLFQFGMLGLLDAVERFDAHKGAKFETFAVHRIKGAILDGLRSADIVPRSERKRQREVENKHNDVEYRTMVKLHMTVEQYHSFLQETEGGIMNPTYSDVTASAEDGLNDVPDDESNNPFEIVHTEQMKTMLIEALEHLPERERLILTLYYYEELTFREIGNVLHLSESRVFQIHTSAIHSLRSLLAEPEPSV